MCMYVLPAGMYMHCVHAWCLKMPEAGVNLLELELQMLWAPIKMLGTNSESLARVTSSLNQSLTSSLSLLSLKFFRLLFCGGDETKNRAPISYVL